MKFINSNNKTIVYLLLIFICVAGFIVYWRNDPVKKINAEARNDVGSWYSRTHLKQNKDLLSVEKAYYKLNDEWNISQDLLDIKDLGADRLFIERTKIFRNDNNAQHLFVHEYYYYDLEATMPVPLKTTASMSTDGSNYNEVENKSLWEGDFDVYCVKPAE